jgi:hypothetical protein
LIATDYQLWYIKNESAQSDGQEVPEEFLRHNKTFQICLIFFGKKSYMPSTPNASDFSLQSTLGYWQTPVQGPVLLRAQSVIMKVTIA